MSDHPVRHLIAMVRQEHGTNRSAESCPLCEAIPAAEAWLKDYEADKKAAADRKAAVREALLAVKKAYDDTGSPWEQQAELDRLLAQLDKEEEP